MRLPLKLGNASLFSVNFVQIFNGDIEFDNVSFTYPDTGIEAIKNLSFKIKKGQKLAILGRTASGKTTIAELLLRFYDVTEGRILLDGIDIRELDIYNLRNKIAYVAQNVFLFSDSISNNVKFGRPDSHPAIMLASMTRPMEQHRRKQCSIVKIKA